MTHVLKDIYQSVTDQIITALEAGTPPWVCPWRGGDADMAPGNLTTSRPYRGINVLLLNMQAALHGYGRNRWLTFQQARAVGACVRKGEHGTPIVFFKMREVDGAASAGDSEPARRVIPLLRSFTVFNADQVDGLPEAMTVPPPVRYSWSPIGAAELLLDGSGAVLRHGGERAFYAPALDIIQMPPREAFDTASDYYGTALHELTHWTGHPSRCNRALDRRHGIDAYAFKELVAEMGSAFLTNHCRLPGKLQHASYIASWLAALRDDKRLIFAAASQAQRAADFVLGSGGLEPVALTAEALAA